MNELLAVCADRLLILTYCVTKKSVKAFSLHGLLLASASIEFLSKGVKRSFKLKQKRETENTD